METINRAGRTALKPIVPVVGLAVIVAVMFCAVWVTRELLAVLGTAGFSVPRPGAAPAVVGLIVIPAALVWLFLDTRKIARACRQNEQPKPQHLLPLYDDHGYEAVMILGESDWEIRCPIGHYKSESAAQAVLNRVTAQLTEINGVAYIAVYSTHPGYCFGPLALSDSDISIREFTAHAKARRGPALDMRLPENVVTAFFALSEADPAYVFEDSDFEPSPLKLADFLLRYGSGYRPDFIGYSVEPHGGSTPHSQDGSPSRD
ncbi:hypothetical protein RMR16_026910 (plasmid) [Agrobacterium sp. rho-13.3]|uniref:hypothetical protein n=1 Tax=Agrobacterium sp. rho-13.3 TaxID=3072980 RepID=UPI002A1756C2|nr:hypothetical protein [Agrobacterium sp. rho-13.3]MDX8311563.1 hypothetical protein [Agrobacterium sp. rho-13.3]